MARLLGPGNIGQVAFIFSVIGILLILTGLGFPQAHQKRLAEGMDPGLCFGTYAAILVVLNSIVVAVGILILPVVMPLLKGPSSSVAFLLFLSYQVLINFAQLFINSFYGQQQFVKSASLTLICRLVRLVLVATILVFNPSLVSLGVCFLGEALVHIALGLYFSRFFQVIRWPTLESFASYWRYAKPIALVSPIGTFVDNLDRFLLGTRFPGAELGCYNTALNLFEAIKTLPSAVATAIFPKMTAEFASGGAGSLKFVFESAQRKLLMVMTPITVLGVAWSSTIIHVLYGESFLRVAPVLAVFFIMFWFVGFVIPYHNILYSTEQHRIFIWLSPLSNCLLALGLWLFTAKNLGWGGVGAAISFILPHLVCFPIVLRETRRFYGIGYPSLFGAHLMAGFLMGAAVFGLSVWKDGIFFLSLWSVLSVSLYATFLYLKKIITSHDLAYLRHTFNPMHVLRYLRADFRS